MSEFSTVLNLLKRANFTGLSNPDVRGQLIAPRECGGHRGWTGAHDTWRAPQDEFHLKAAPLVEEVQELVHRFEEAEGKRRAELKRKRLAEEQARQLADKIGAVKDMQTCKERLKAFRKVCACGGTLTVVCLWRLDTRVLHRCNSRRRSTTPP